MTAAEKFANSPSLTVAARIAMFLTPILVSIALFILGNYMAAQAAADDKRDARVTLVERDTRHLETRATVLENAIITGRASTTETLTRLDRMQESIVQLSNAVAALNATLKAQENRRP